MIMSMVSFIRDDICVTDADFFSSNATAVSVPQIWIIFWFFIVDIWYVLFYELWYQFYLLKNMYTIW